MFYITKLVLCFYSMKKIRQKQNSVSLDGLVKNSRRPDFFDFKLARYVVQYKKSSVYFSKQGIPRRMQGGSLGQESRSVFQGMDSVFTHHGGKNYMYKKPKRQRAEKEEYWLERLRNPMRNVSVVKMWNISIVGAVIFGMLTMTMVYRYLGQNVSARIQEGRIKEEKQQEIYFQDEVDDPGEINEEIDIEFITRFLHGYSGNVKENEEREAREKFEEDIAKMVKGYPIATMVPQIAKKDKIVAAFIISIAKKESNWGKRSPKLEGKDCYNYWGFKGRRDRMGTGGHTCFYSPEDAVNTVAKRIEFLVSNQKLNTPGKMIVWKCGYDCSWDNPESVKKWVRDVGVYFRKLNKE